MFDSSLPFLRNFWYLVLPSNKLMRGEMVAKSLLNEPVVVGRRDDGKTFALRNSCPHRGLPLSYGGFDGIEIECPYHGWRFATDGRCKAIPSLTPKQDIAVEQIRCGFYPCREVQGNIWVYVPDKSMSQSKVAFELLPDPPQVPSFEHSEPDVAISQTFTCSSDHAAFGLMDPAHAAYVHTSWWWKKRPRKLSLKEKHFEPTELGWRMKRHSLPTQNRIYKLLGQHVTTEIIYALPGLRFELVNGDRHRAASLTALTPVSENETEVHQILYWTLPWSFLLRSLVRHLAHTFLAQDKEMIIKQQEGLKYNPPLMLIDDADTQAKWYYQLKREWLRAAEEGRSFQNPLKPCTLRWRS